MGEPLATEQSPFGGALSPAAPAGERLTSPAEARASEAADRMGVLHSLDQKVWNSPGTRILILEHIAKLENEASKREARLENEASKREARLENMLSELEGFRSRFYEKDKECAVLRQRVRQSTSVDMLFDFSLAAGGTLVGLATFLFDKGLWIIGLVVLVIGIILFVSPLLMKYYQKAD